MIACRSRCTLAPLPVSGGHCCLELFSDLCGLWGITIRSSTQSNCELNTRFVRSIINGFERQFVQLCEKLV